MDAGVEVDEVAMVLVVWNQGRSVTDSEVALL